MFTLWICIDQKTKLMPRFVIGKRSADNCRRFMVDVAGRLVMPDTRPHFTDAQAFKPEGHHPVIQISSDGFAPYPEAVDLAFGPYRQVRDDHQGLQERRHALYAFRNSRHAVPCGLQYKGHPKNALYARRTSMRNNLTIRTFICRFTRLSLGFTKKLENLAAAVALHVAYYNFFRRHGSLRITPAMAAAVTD